ncbi:hypothetical protein ABW16_15920 [Mycolicibacter heraklionensis]|uniref:Uncharacterized protein n=1 Tax=Mycolicibacter heraklionensis TaxID=512402 RepID=A0ABR5FCQ3_9MYCO|nr:hypothetical protein [Mycolicibacter heraklionensis]KLO27415.1 hypothetical protein ABW16_15920 [Mycolicibacter heraklionensis]
MGYRCGGSVITVGSSGTLGIGGMVITDGRCGRWRCGGSLGAGACCAGGCCGGACRGGAAVGAVVLDALDELVVLLVLAVVLVVLDELVAGVVLPPPGPRLVSWMIPQITSASITAMRPNQAISTDRRRNHGVADDAAKSTTCGSVGSSKAL